MDASDSEDTRRPAKLAVRLSADELAALDAFAASIRVKRSDAVRALILRPAEEVRGMATARPRIVRRFAKLTHEQDDVLRGLSREVGKVGVTLTGVSRNWNQVARRMNAHEAFTDADRRAMAALHASLEAAQAQLAELARTVNTVYVEQPAGGGGDAEEG